MIEQNAHLQASGNNNFQIEYAFVIHERLTRPDEIVQSSPAVLPSIL